MKELKAITANVFGADIGETFESRAEVILIYSEPAYQVDDAGELLRRREVGHFRLIMSEAGIDYAIKALASIQKECKKRNKKNPQPSLESEPT